MQPPSFLAGRLYAIVEADVSVAITVSLGVAALASGDDAARFIARADAALYKSKQDGRDRVTLSS
jgi:PleD family two-component response regulator